MSLYNLKVYQTIKSLPVCQKCPFSRTFCTFKSLPSGFLATFREFVFSNAKVYQFIFNKFVYTTNSLPMTFSLKNIIQLKVYQRYIYHFCIVQ